ncbi:MAG: hypothetical protein KIT79_15650 [Deltaproteobacteria bacterium]|nr:hypothetical protein [Deltaproteobacteria bacterium]
MRIWLHNLWLVPGGLLLLAVTAGLGPEHFNGVIRHYFLRDIVELPPRVRLELHILYWFVLLTGTGTLLSWFMFSLRKTSVWGWLTGGAGFSLTTGLLILCVAANGLFLADRLIRQTAMEIVWAGKDVDQRRQLRFLELGDIHSLRPETIFDRIPEIPDAFAIFRAPPEGESELLMPTYYLNISYHFFPTRVYFRRIPACEERAEAAAWARSRGIRYAVWDCGTRGTLPPLTALETGIGEPGDGR